MATRTDDLYSMWFTVIPALGSLPKQMKTHNFFFLKSIAILLSLPLLSCWHWNRDVERANPSYLIYYTFALGSHLSIKGKAEAAIVFEPLCESLWVSNMKKIQSEKKIRILTVEWFFSQLLWFGPIWEEISFWMKSHILIEENHPPSFSMFQAGAWNRCKQVAVSHPTGLEVGRAGRNVRCRATIPACDSLPADISLQVIKYTLGVLKQEVKIQAWVRSYSPAPRHALLYML